MSFIEVLILIIIVPFSSHRLAIILDEDIATTPHIPIKSLHNRWLLELFSEFFLCNKKLSILEYLK